MNSCMLHGGVVGTRSLVGGRYCLRSEQEAGDATIPSGKNCDMISAMPQVHKRWRLRFWPSGQKAFDKERPLGQNTYRRQHSNT
jgi:hypothetical protein